MPLQSVSTPSHTSVASGFTAASPSSQSPAHTIHPSPSLSSSSRDHTLSQSVSSPSHSSLAPGFTVASASSQSPSQTR